MSKQNSNIAAAIQNHMVNSFKRPMRTVSPNNVPGVSFIRPVDNCETMPKAATGKNSASPTSGRTEVSINAEYNGAHRNSFESIAPTMLPRKISTKGKATTMLAETSSRGAITAAPVMKTAHAPSKPKSVRADLSLNTNSAAAKPIAQTINNDK